ncbi:hypothetical protein COW36_11810 [bacterium (Candidatus Blackallbacteria) CG17_big_fil_post_rev_8_21_14_2_50_48_46]|uniref:Peptidase M48 domain-containing protein n=1 Tax=bacterium (Candidatus Blackallbacteria) CG17_big_fil_post_rev_8_21_14_2_50_48_46 TaxID=2014261 RepID=A0A2M7G3K2_9BACT|nr:MAG: hypothetical protein COW64_03455 [bacterium (Candidatus Blackallbacteria) CG18_big_fil_WC_8_21_14_2_50_49_26]PIW16449.1 MAG: hypothetical protein COW36_11810 [bacterium (Candidatus Blackallbacteria) CG17_big_fil_post_rev_8_21_14_2_50_48_46]PIW45957.1 MAG: hypothetical protein COW20_17075 [bacterium (Candidatus Blackallbacteria) CG13_big_fil_rev_8_21_14_2_50_49_14]
MNSTPVQEQNTVNCSFCGKTHSIRPETLSKIEIRCSQCKLMLSSTPHSHFQHLDPAVYRHQLDTDSQQHLRSLPGVDNIIRKLLDFAQEAFPESFFAANCIQASPQQYADLHAKLEVACRTLGMTLRPHLYISPEDMVSSTGWGTFSGGTDKPFIVLPVTLLENFEEHEILAVLAHEMGHFQLNQHAVKVAADFLQLMLTKPLRRNPMGAFLENITPPVQNALLNWRYKADLSADRSALLVLQNPEQLAQLLMKIAGNASESTNTLENFITQARNLDRQSILNWLDKPGVQQLCPTPPRFAVWRMAELLSWTSDDMKTYGYSKIIKVFAAS